MNTTATHFPISSQHGNGFIVSVLGVDPPPVGTRETSIITARCYLAEARRVRLNPVCRDFYWTLLGWAAAARCRAASVRPVVVQGDLFGGMQ